ncbi:MAG: hypothetical protein HFE39_04485 [Clostridiales bacterium]|nr:hypothetical protein [Clostridiales bacterium]
MARLGDIFERQIAGEWGSECAENENGTKVLRTTNFTQEGRINYDDVVIRSINQSKVEKKRCHYGDIILEKSGGTEKTPVGRVVFCDEAIEDSIYLCNNFTQAMRVNQATAIPRYVFYFMWNLHSSGKTDLLQNKTTGIRNLQVKSYLNENCPLPALEEQRKIAAVLDKVSDLIAKRRQQLDKLDELVKSRFIEMFGDPVQNSLRWSTRPLLEMGYCKNGMNFHTGDYGIEMHCLGVGDFKNYSVIDGTNHLPIVSLNEAPSEESMLQDGDIVFVRSNGNKALVGRCLVVYPRSTPTTYSGFCIRYRLTSDEVNTAYLLRVLKTDSMRERMAGRGANIQNLNQQILATLNIPTPPMELQEQFAAFVETTDKSKSFDDLEVAA